MWTPTSTPILVLGSLALFTAAVQAILFVLAIRAFILGLDYAWECSWQFPGCVAATFSRLRQWRHHAHTLALWAAALGLRAGTLRSRAARRGRALRKRARPLSLALILPLNLPMAAGSTAGHRRPVNSQHYQTVGERMRARQRIAA